MYSPKLVASRISALTAAFPGPDLISHTPQEVEAWTARLADARDSKGAALRELSQEEEGFIRNELILCKSSYRYWAERYSKCSAKGVRVKTMFPLLPSQEVVLDALARLEEEVAESPDEDGILVNLLKARRIGGTTLAVSLDAHRLTLQTNIKAVMAADVPDNTSYNFSMFRLIYDELPWWLKPGLVRYSNTYPEVYEFDNGSQVWCHAGQSVRGTTGERGQIARGKGISVCHLGELCLWEDTGQIDAALLPAIEADPRTLAIFESSPLGQSSWWHKAWKASIAGVGRFRPIFVPWYAETRRYRKAAPPAWAPKDSTLAHARRCEEQGPRWLGRTVSLTRDQLYWYELTRAAYEFKNELNTFLSEYSADPSECFTFSGRPLIPIEVIQRVKDQAKPLLGVFDVAPLMDLQGEGRR